MKITNMEELKEIVEELDKLQNRVTDCIKLEDDELNGDYDIYNQISNIIAQIEDLTEV